jgi:hypothetical protein
MGKQSRKWTYPAFAGRWIFGEAWIAMIIMKQWSLDQSDWFCSVWPGFFVQLSTLKNQEPSSEICFRYGWNSTWILIILLGMYMAHVVVFLNVVHCFFHVYIPWNMIWYDIICLL